VVNKVRACNECEKFKDSQPREPLMQDERPTRPGEAVACDLFSYGKGEYLVIVDKYIGWSEIKQFGQGVSTADVKSGITRWMAMLEVPVRMTTDGGPQFKGIEFADLQEVGYLP
jgi:hypothetical protein